MVPTDARNEQIDKKNMEDQTTKGVTPNWEVMPLNW